jgi:arylsulfatase A-like enzyme
MNIILIVSDTLRRDHLSCYGNKWISTPYIEKFAKNSFVFDNAYTASFPTVPNRTDLITGRWTFTYHDWAPLPKEEIVLSSVLRESGYITMMIVDTPHIMKDGYNFDRDYHGWIWIRGQENDRFMTDPIEIKLPSSPFKLRAHKPDTLIQHLRNTSLNKHEEDTFVAKTMNEASKWLERNYKHNKFFLYVDTFDPHEPWDPPHYFVDMYDKNYKGEEILYPYYGPYKGIYTQREIKHLRAHYAGEVTLVDRWVGKLFQKIEDLGLFSNTIIIFTTDHGFYIGEHGFTGKSYITKDFQGLLPLYNEITHIPLIIYCPNTKGKRIKAFVQPPDIMPTILEFANVKVPPTVQGKSLLPVIKKNLSIRDFAVSSPSIKWKPGGGRRITFTTKDWTLIYKGEDIETKEDVHLRIVDGNIRKQLDASNIKNALFNRKLDPYQKNNVFNKNKEIAKQLHKKLIEFLKNLNTPEEYLQYWDNI